jgi:ribonuclease VapC
VILDSSAIVAIATEEPGCLEILEKLDQAATLAVGAPTLVETALVLRSRLAMEPRAFLERFLTDWNVSVVPFGEDHWKMAVDAYARFGRGHHKAALDFGDCLSYATAKLADMPLLCTGGDFSKTDLAIG